MKKRMHLLLLLQLLSLASCADYEFFVSVDGSDLWDGTSDSHVEGTNVGPWQTLNHAVDEMRKVRPSPPTPDSRAIVNFLKGTHFLTDTVELYNMDSFLTIKALNQGLNSIESQQMFELDFQCRVTLVGLT